MTTFKKVSPHCHLNADVQGTKFEISVPSRGPNLTFKLCPCMECYAYSFMSSDHGEYIDGEKTFTLVAKNRPN